MIALKKERENKKKRAEKKKYPKVAPGNIDEYLEDEATQKEKEKGDFTRVTRLSWDEVEE